MAGNLETGKPREPSDFDGERDDIEVTARRPTTMAESLNARRSGRLKQEGGRLHDDPADDAGHAARRFRKASQREEQRPGDAPGANAGEDPARHAPPDAGSEPEVSTRKETSLADELGVQTSGRLKHGQERQHGRRNGSDEPEGNVGHRSRSRTSRLRAETAGDAPADGDATLARGPDGGHAARLRASKTARHALRFAEDAGAVANASVIGEDDRDTSEDAVDETRKRIRPYGRRAISRTRKGAGATTAAAVPNATRAAPETAGAEAGTARLRDGPAFAAKSSGKTTAPGNAADGGGRLSGLWKRRTWKQSARTESAVRKAAKTGETETLKGLAALKARVRRMFVAGGGGRAAVAIAAAIVLLAMVAMSALSTCSTVATGVVQAAAATSYTADDQEIKDADAAYTQMEAALEGQAQSAESSHPGYDEYRYQIGELGHDPYALASILTARYGDYKADDVAGFLREILAAQYDLTFVESTETEYTTVIDEATGEPSTQETTRRILTVRLVNHGLDHAARQVLTAEELASYETTYATRGNREELFPAPYPGNYGSTGAGFDWQPPGEAMSDAKFAAMYNEGKKYLGWPYVWGGGSPETGFDCSGYVSWVLTASGVCNTGRQITDGLLQFCSQVSREQAHPGDLVFFTGTYETDLLTSHVGIYLGDGMMMHCGDPIQITSLDTPYWQAHLYGFGRLK